MLCTETFDYVCKLRMNPSRGIQAEKLRAECEKWKRLAAEQEAMAQVPITYLTLSRFSPQS